ncbi:MAG: bifunctional oligoribonuclease/PAP phosphatase NrnA [Actinobacteria bacterium]|nr:bifunctional oligoribonuclease/PAP phosphatase NrnA [Actinomycetota bacterium]MCG2788557.1 bifunctional oligoribonuclease/PAP phosphatase NrnA [Actinomycetes bacterium]
MGSQVAFFELLINLHKKVSMICASDIPYQYKFLPNVNKIKNGFDKLELDCISKDCVCICLDCADEGRLNLDILKLKEKVFKIINIDHHLGNTDFGDINVVDSAKSATAEILYEFINQNFKDYMNYNIAVGIYTGILTDTGKFQYANTTSSVHKIVSNLLEFGVNPSEAFSCIYENEPYGRFKLIELVISRIKLIKSKKLIYSYLLQKDLEELNLPFSAHDGVIELLRSAADAKIAVLFKQMTRGNFKVSLRSTESCYNVAEIAAKFGGGGHRMASAYAQKGSLEEVIANLVNAVNTGSIS